MKVHELIQKLNEFDSEKEVYILASDDNPINNGFEISDVFTINGSKDNINNAVYIVEV